MIIGGAVNLFENQGNTELNEAIIFKFPRQASGIILF